MNLAAPLLVDQRTLELSLVIPIRPRGQGRPRFDPRSGRAYTDEKTRAHVATITAAAHATWAPKALLTGPVALCVRCIFALPKRAVERAFHVQKPDGSNCFKAAEDALIGVVIADDAQVTEGAFRKEWSVAGDAIAIQVWSLS